MIDKSTDASKQLVATSCGKANPRSAGWSGFAQKLAPVLANLAEDQYLIISVKHSNRFVQFSAQGNFGLRAETTSNHFLEKSEKLDRKQRAALLDIGWAAPTGTPRQSTPEKDPDGSPNHFVDFPAPVDFARVVDLAVTTFADVLRVPYPGMLQYEAFDCESNTALRLGDLGLKQVQRQSQADGARDSAKVSNPNFSSRQANLV